MSGPTISGRVVGDEGRLRTSAGYRYRDVALARGPVKSAQLKRTRSGTFVLKVAMSGKGTVSIDVAPGAPTGSYATNLAVGGGDQYCSGSAGTSPLANSAARLRVVGDGTPDACGVGPCAAGAP